MIRWRYYLLLILTLPAAPLGFVVKVYFASFVTGWKSAGRVVGRFLRGYDD